MTRATSSFLDTGDTFPELNATTVSHGEVRLPDYWGDDWGVLLVYRAHW